MSGECLACGGSGAGGYMLSGPLGFSFVQVHRDQPLCVEAARVLRGGGVFTPWAVEESKQQVVLVDWPAVYAERVRAGRDRRAAEREARA
jgi:hypothetical protein